jgi:hypothetical protein
VNFHSQHIAREKQCQESGRRSPWHSVEDHEPVTTDRILTVIFMLSIFNFFLQLFFSLGRPFFRPVFVFDDAIIKKII